MNLPREYLELLTPIFKAYTKPWEVWLYGSRASGLCHAGSDLDLLLRHPTEPETPFPRYFELVEAIHDSVLPVAFDVTDWARLDPRYRRWIEAYAVKIYDPQEYSYKHQARQT